MAWVQSVYHECSILFIFNYVEIMFSYIHIYINILLLHDEAICQRCEVVNIL